MEVLFGIKPNYHGLKVFRCLCFPYLRSYNAHKLYFKSSPCTFLGYAADKKGYKCIDSNGKIFISRHVVFNEQIFSFNNINIKNSLKNTQCKVFYTTIT